MNTNPETREWVCMSCGYINGWDYTICMGCYKHIADGAPRTDGKRVLVVYDADGKEGQMVLNPFDRNRVKIDEKV